MLLHKRALGKYHSGGLWTNSCCSHPRYGENLMDAVIRRTKEELGLDISSYADELKEVGRFHYYKNIVLVLKMKLIMSFCLQWKNNQF